MQSSFRICRSIMLIPAAWSCSTHGKMLYIIKNYSNIDIIPASISSLSLCGYGSMLFDPFSLVCNTLLLTLALFVQLVSVDVVFPMDVLLQQCASWVSQALQSTYITLIEPRSLAFSRNPFLTNGGYRVQDWVSADLMFGEDLLPVHGVL